VGGVGLAILAPAYGFVYGVQNGKPTEAILYGAGGAVVGVVGGAGMIIGGAVLGVSHIVRGVVAMPKAMRAVKKGKWWNETTHKWVLTDLAKADVPDNDDDLLQFITDDLDEAGKPDAEHSGCVKETLYYDILEVDPKAEPSAIKRRYYILARKHHPDKVGQDDTESADKFKNIAEAYQVLSDPGLREKYDKDGMDALSGDKTEIVQNSRIDPSIMMAFLFGSDKFNDYYGRLATSTSAMLGDTPNLSFKDARTLQERRCTRLAKKLASKVDVYPLQDDDVCKTIWKEEAESLKNTSYGWELIQVLGMAYEVTATQFLGSKESGIGMPSISTWAKSKQAHIKRKRVGTKNNAESAVAAADIMETEDEYKQKMEAATSDDEKAVLLNELEEKTQDITLRIIWTTNVVDITSTIHETCQMLFFDKSVDKSIRKQRAYGVKELGVTFQACPEPEGTNHDAKNLFEEASLAAMIETIRRKDEATYSASSPKL